MRVILYARLSLARDESVSIDRQFEAGRLTAKAREWTVVAEYKDEGVSATLTRPEDRTGWRRVLEHPDKFDAVVVWKVDRLARRVLDFLHAHEALQERNAGIVAVEDPIDMTTAQGRAFAVMLTVFGEMEAAAMSARVKAARAHLVREGRVVGGTVPYGWKSVANPNGPGYVLAQDAERIGYVQAMAQRALGGASVYSIVQWLDSVGAPLPSASQQGRKSSGWNYASVERLLRNPLLAGMTPYQPGRKRHEPRDPAAVLRDEDGLPVVDKSVAILTTEQRRHLLDLLANREAPQARPRASREATSPLLSRLVTCGHCHRLMHRGTNQGRPTLSCPGCHQTISRRQLEKYLTGRLLLDRGHMAVWEHTVTTDSDAADLREIEAAIGDTLLSMARDEADVPVLLERLTALKGQRAKARGGGAARHTWTMTTQTVREAWHGAQDDLERRSVLAQQIARISIVRGKVGRHLDPNRVVIEWQPDPAAIMLPGGQRLVEGPVNPEREAQIGGIVFRVSANKYEYYEKA